MNESPSPEFSSPTFAQKKREMAEELVHLYIYRESQVLTFVPSPLQLGSKRVPNFYIIHDSPEEQTLTKGWLLTGVDYINFLRRAVWFIKIKYKN